MTADFWNRMFSRPERVIPPPEPPLADQAGVPAMAHRALPMPRHPDVTVFGDWRPPPLDRYAAGWESDEETRTT